MKKLLFFASVLAVAAGCAKEISPIVDNSHSFTLIAEIADNTRTTIDDESGAMMWSAGDQISVLDNTGEVNTPFTLVETTPTSTGTFTGDFEGTPVYAVYPYNEGNIAIEGEVDIELPSSYVYDGTSTHAPMLASVSSTNELTSGTAKFSHVAGLIKVTYENVPTTAKSFRFTATKTVTGAFSVSNEAISASETDKDDKIVTYSFEEPSESMSFYVPAPCGTYGFSIALLDAEGNKIAKTGKKVSSTTIGTLANFRV